MIRSVSTVSLVAFGLVAVVTLLARTTTPRPMLARFRALLPAWRLFDRAARGPALYIRTSRPDAPDVLGDWRRVPSGSRPAGSALFAPEANLVLAYQACVDHLVAALGELDLEEAPVTEIETDPRVTCLVSYELVGRVARAYAGDTDRVQWKIVVDDEPGDYIVSSIAERTA